MNGRGDRDRDYGRGGSSDFYRGGPPHFPPGGGGGGDFYGGGPSGGYGGGPGYQHPRDFRDGNRGPLLAMSGRGGGPPPPRYMDRGAPMPPRGGGGGPSPPNNKRRPPPPGIPIFRSYDEEREWVEERRRKRLARQSKFDVMSSENTVGNVFTSNVPPATNYEVSNIRISEMNKTTNYYSNNSTNPNPRPADTVALPQQTRHARRLYVGNLPPQITEDQIHRVFRDAIKEALVIPQNGDPLPFNADEDPILSVYINHERRFCFLEFKSVELCSACMALDGLEVVKGHPPVKVKRPNDYNSSQPPKSQKIPELDVSRLGIISPTVLDGPNKIFIGGLHYHMQESQVLELLQAFGKVKAFHLVKNDPEAVTSKGYCFAEYADHRLTPTVVASLNGMDIGGGKSITARLAGERYGTVAPVLLPNNTPIVPVPPIVQAQQIQQQMAGLGQPSISPDRTIVNGYDVDVLVDAALGNCPMPTAPSYFDSFGQPLTRIAQVIPQPISIPALTPQQEQAINALPSLSSLPPLHTVGNLVPISSVPTGMVLPGPYTNSLPPLSNNMTAIQPTTVPALTPEQQAAVNALSFIPGLNAVSNTHQSVSTSSVARSRVLVLLNMVSDEDLATADDHAALVDEIRDECMKYGVLRSVIVPREVTGLAEVSSIRKVFLEYNTVDDAMKAESELSGRQFGPNVVQTQFYSETDFAEGRLR